MRSSASSVGFDVQWPAGPTVKTSQNDEVDTPDVVNH